MARIAKWIKMMIRYYSRSRLLFWLCWFRPHMWTYTDQYSYDIMCARCTTPHTDAKLKKG